MIKSSSEPALRAGSEGGYFKIFLGGGFREFSIQGGFWNTPPLAIPGIGVYPSGRKNLEITPPPLRNLVKKATTRRLKAPPLCFWPKLEN